MIYEPMIGRESWWECKTDLQIDFMILSSYLETAIHHEVLWKESLVKAPNTPLTLRDHYAYQYRFGLNNNAYSRAIANCNMPHFRELEVLKRRFRRVTHEG